MLLDDLRKKLKISRQGLHYRLKLAREAFPNDDWNISRKNIKGRSRALISHRAAMRIIEYHEYSHRVKP